MAPFETGQLFLLALFQDMTSVQAEPGSDETSQ